MKRFDFLVIGGGIAGLSFALEASAKGSVAILFKKDFEVSSTSWAQGGIATVSDSQDNFDLHVNDTLVAGAGLCKKNIVELVVREGPERIQALIDWGVQFDTEKDGHFHLHKEAGHSRRRIFHAADLTGHEVIRALLARARANSKIKLFSYASAIDLITTHKVLAEEDKPNRVLGAYVWRDGKVDSFLADKVLVATGGAGKVYLYTSNPDVASGDGIAMCYRAGVPVVNMEFFQFHPTCLYHPKAKSFLITEALRGEGAKLRRLDGQPFMQNYHKDAELAPRDIVARAIDQELKRHGDDYVLLDISFRPADFIKEHFPNIYQRCLEYNIDITREAIPVVPAAHYCCGGVECNEWAETNIKNLYVAGECAHTGLHGANRLASNSLLEGLVFSHRAAVRAVEHRERYSPIVVPDWNPGLAVDSDEQVVISQTWDEIRRFMWNYVGIVRSNKRLRRALTRSESLMQEIDQYYWDFTITPDLIELRNLALVSNLVIRSALMRKESRGLHFNLDYPTLSSDGPADSVLLASSN